MKIIENKLKQLLTEANPDWDSSNLNLVNVLISLGIEVESVKPIWNHVGPIVIGKVVDIEFLSGYKKPIRLCKVKIGANEVKKIICGADNFHENDYVIVALSDSVLGGNFKITPRKTYGHMSEGMLCSTVELGLSDTAAGILVLPNGNSAINNWEMHLGESAQLALGLEGNILDVTTTPDRGYLMSYRGLARDIATALNLNFVDLVPPVSSLDVNGQQLEKVKLELMNHDLSKSFCAVHIDFSDSLNESPWWLQKELTLVGIKSKNLLIDVTNYVMLELGQPMHVYDANVVANHLVMRLARVGEKIITLDDEIKELTETDIVIANENEILGLAGILGGLKSKVSDTTSEIILEAAHFESKYISKTSRRLKINTEASKRYERGVDPNLAAKSLQYAIELYQTIAPKIKISRIAQIEDSIDSKKVLLPYALIENYTSLQIEPIKIKEILTKYGYIIEQESISEVLVTIPSWRGEVNSAIDLVEDIIRIVGYTEIIPKIPTANLVVNKSNSNHLLFNITRSLAIHNFVQVLASPFMNPKKLNNLKLPRGDMRNNYVKLVNPIDVEYNAFASTLIPDIFSIAKRNFNRGNKNISIFAIGSVAFSTSKSYPAVHLKNATPPTAFELDTITAALPIQQNNLVAYVSGTYVAQTPLDKSRSADVFDILGIIELIAKISNNNIFKKNKNIAPFHPGRGVELYINDELIGHAGQVHPRVTELFELPKESFILELNLDKVVINPEIKITNLSEFPPVKQDLSILVDKEIPANLIQTALQTGAGDLLTKIELYDQYESEHLGKNKKSLTFSLTIQAENKTLTDVEACEVRDNAVAYANKLYGVELRLI